MLKPELIESKLATIRTMVNDLQNNRKVLHRIGGATIQTMGEEVDFQQSRLDNLTWAQTATDADIQARIDDLTASLTPEVLACKYGSVRGLELETILTIAKIEDCEIALGTHPAVKGVG